MSKVSLSKGTTILNHTDCRASLLSVAKGSAVWTIVRKLSDAALDKAAMEAGVPALLEHDTQADSIMREGSVPTNELLIAIQKEYRCLIAEAIETRHRQRQQAQYASDLDNRMKAATKTIMQSKADMEALSKSGDIQYLSENSRLDRSEMVLRIREAQQQLKELQAAAVHDDAVLVKDTYAPNLLTSSGKSDSHRFTGGITSSEKSNGSSSSTIRKKPTSHIVSLEELDPLITFLEEYAESSTSTVSATPSNADALSSRALQRLVEQSESMVESLVQTQFQSSKLIRDSTARMMRP
jgi:hypothetical protein